ATEHAPRVVQPTAVLEDKGVNKVPGYLVVAEHAVIVFADDVQICIRTCSEGGYHHRAQGRKEQATFRDALAADRDMDAGSMTGDPNQRFHEKHVRPPVRGGLRYHGNASFRTRRPRTSGRGRAGGAGA